MLNVIITTIQPPTPCVERLAEKLASVDARLVVAGDTKGPHRFDLSQVSGFSSDRLEFLSLKDQLRSAFSLAPLLPTKHYCRKNIAYLQAVRSGASCIYETDDDNAPLDAWSPRQEWIGDLRFVESHGAAPAWVNVYRSFTEKLIWPRGLPLDRIHEQSASREDPVNQDAFPIDREGKYWAPIQQGLANGAPDVDAVWRLVFDNDFEFEFGRSVMLSPGQWCPFNTQTTWWWPEVYPLLYVPSYCSFRMCDIWKSFVAQRCLWEFGTGVVFHAAEVVQDRNPHNLMRDFSDEVPGYLENHRIASILEGLSLDSTRDAASENLRRCYAALVNEGLFPEKELALVDAWIYDVEDSIDFAKSGEGRTSQG